MGWFQADASTSGTMSSRLVLARAVSRSYMRWRLSQNSGVVPRAFAIRSAVPAVIERRSRVASGLAL